MDTETQGFLADMLPKQVAAERAIHNGEVEPRLALWSHHDPVTLFGAVLTRIGLGAAQRRLRHGRLMVLRVREI